jgi:hypothetical protein
LRPHVALADDGAVAIQRDLTLEIDDLATARDDAHRESTEGGPYP